MKNVILYYFSLAVCGIAFAGCEPETLPERYLSLKVCPTYVTFDAKRASIDDLSLFGSLSSSDVVLLSFGDSVSNELLQTLIAHVQQTGANVSYTGEANADCGDLVARDFWYPEKPNALPNSRLTAIFRSKEAVEDYISILKELGATFHAYEIHDGAVIDAYGLTESQEREVCYRSKRCTRVEDD